MSLKKESTLTSAREYSAGKFKATCPNEGYPVQTTIIQDGQEKLTVSHSELADLIHVLRRMQAHLYHHRELSGRSHEAE